MGPSPPLQQLGLGTSRWRLEGNATLGLRAGGRGHHLFSCRTRVRSWDIASNELRAQNVWNLEISGLMADAKSKRMTSKYELLSGRLLLTRRRSSATAICAVTVFSDEGRWAGLAVSVVGTNATNRHAHSDVRFREQEQTRYARFEFFAF
jgi:hypothetical protein